MNNVDTCTLSNTIVALKKGNRRFFLIVIFALIPVSFIFGNPFFGAPSYSPKNSTPDVADTELSEDENTIPIDAVEKRELSTPVPVRVGSTNADIAKKQGDIRESIATFFKEWQRATGGYRTQILLNVILLSFLYGIIHAAGPGHRKTIMFSFYLTRSAPWWEPSVTGFLLAFLHGSCAIVLILIFKGVSGSISSHSDFWAIYLEGFSYILIIVTALILLIITTINYVKNSKKINKKEDKAAFKLLPFIVSGAYPCPGAILVLVLSFTLDILPLGIIAVCAMSLGMVIPVIASGYLAWFGRTGLFRLLKNNSVIAQRVAFAVEIFGYTLLIIFSVYIASPFFAGLLG